MSVATAESEFLRRLVRERSGIVLGEDTDYLLESRLLPLAKVTGLNTIDALVARLRFEPLGQLARQVVEAMTINETFFFRDVAMFGCLNNVVLPELIGKRSQERRLDIWCAASSTGQEPYSIAMSLREHAKLSEDWQIRMIATDIAPTALKRGQEGRYSQLEVNRGLPAPLLSKWFTKEGLDWRVNDALRRTIDFRELNLLDTWPLTGAFDIIFIRNVLIYFDVNCKRQILGKCRKLLRPDGFLFLDGAESPLHIDDAFVRVEFDKGGCYQLKPTGGTP